MILGGQRKSGPMPKGRKGVGVGLGKMRVLRLSIIQGAVGGMRLSREEAWAGKCQTGIVSTGVENRLCWNIDLLSV